jgi:hypothetical protein
VKQLVSLLLLSMRFAACFPLQATRAQSSSKLFKAFRNTIHRGKIRTLINNKNFDLIHLILFVRSFFALFYLLRQFPKWRE